MVYSSGSKMTRFIAEVSFCQLLGLFYWQVLRTPGLRWAEPRVVKIATNAQGRWDQPISHPVLDVQQILMSVKNLYIIIHTKGLFYMSS